MSFYIGIDIEQTHFDFKLFAITGDLPALNLALNFIGHNGYFACHHCYVHGVHKENKRQYPYDPSTAVRTSSEFASDSLAALQSDNQRGLLGTSVLLNQLDCELPYSILIDYAHTTLLRHGKLILSNFYARLRPVDCTKLDEQLASQAFPHFFHRKLRRLNDLSFIKATEVRNILFYALLPLTVAILPLDLLSHVALFIAAIRLFHGQPLFGSNTPLVAHDLFVRYYEQFEKFFPDQLHLTLHQHVHFKEQYRRFGSLCYTGSFGQESLIGYIGANSQGTRYLGDSICQIYSIDFALQHHLEDSASSVNSDGPMDNERTFDFSSHPSVVDIHKQLCDCPSIDQCVRGFQRCQTNRKCFHSLSYTRRRKSVSFFVRYSGKDSASFFFGKIIIFFTCKTSTFALVQVYPLEKSFSDLFRASQSYFLMRNSLDRLFYLLSPTPSLQLQVVLVDDLVDHCIIFDHKQHLVATPVSSYDEHN